MEPRLSAQKARVNSPSHSTANHGRNNGLMTDHDPNFIRRFNVPIITINPS